MEHAHEHELTAAYALDALSPDDASRLEEHLRGCDRCRSDLAAFRETASALALAVPAVDPPASLRQRILDEARAERPNVVPLPRGWAFRAATAAAAVAAAAAIGLGLWATSLSSSLSEERAARDRLGSVAEIMARPGARRIPVAGEEGVLVVAPGGDAALVLSSLDPAPEGKTYQAWVIEGATPVPAGLFEAERRAAAIALARRVTPGSTVAVTVEPDGGLPAPSGEPIFTAETA
jgi:anti-sigma-K factor RskA